MAAQREAFRDLMPTLDPGHLVFVDESGAQTNMVRTHARSPRGTRARGSAPESGYEQLTMLGALSLSGLQALMTIKAATDTDVMIAFVEHVLVPTLRPGQIVILDNLAPHKAPRVRALIEAAGCRLLLLPPYSPWHGQVDFFFVDGAHSYEYVKSDTENALRCVREGGIIAWHDFGRRGVNGVSRLIGELAAEGQKIYVVPGGSLAYTRARG